MFRFVVLLSVLLVAAACGEGDTTSTPASSSSSGSEPAHALDAVPLDTWLVVRSVEGRGIAVGSGVRFRAGMFDVVSGAQASSFPMTCPEDGSFSCEALGRPMQLEIVSGRLRVTQPGLVLLLDPADAQQGASFDEALAASEAQRAACVRTADCCVALENAGHACDLTPLLGDRTRAACEAGLRTLTERLASEHIEPPAECR